ncbi:MAG TPA: 4a-hydroxytetrahydrobiopterin dehydratase [Nitrospirota bacterium]|nr:4a-hydroxytetrahydrobiopterin dehydratase [Nitrospirota bacterium]
MKLAEQACKPLQAGTAPLSHKETEELLREIPQWSLSEKSIQREYRFKDFRQAMDFVNNVASVANDQDHHPDILVSYNKVRLILSTHKIGGLSLNDFIMAAKIDLLTVQRRP